MGEIYKWSSNFSVSLKQAPQKSVSWKNTEPGFSQKLVWLEMPRNDSSWRTEIDQDQNSFWTIISALIPA